MAWVVGKLPPGFRSNSNSSKNEYYSEACLRRGSPGGGGVVGEPRLGASASEATPPTFEILERHFGRGRLAWGWLVDVVIVAMLYNTVHCRLVLGRC